MISLCNDNIHNKNIVKLISLAIYGLINTYSPTNPQCCGIDCSQGNFSWGKIRGILACLKLSSGFTWHARTHNINSYDPHLILSKWGEVIHSNGGCIWSWNSVDFLPILRTSYLSLNDPVCYWGFAVEAGEELDDHWSGLNITHSKLFWRFGKFCWIKSIHW